LRDANLRNANLRDANLIFAALSDADLSRADLTGAGGASKENLAQQADSVEGATRPDGSKHPYSGLR
jgi:hypothetical protein